MRYIFIPTLALDTIGLLGHLIVDIRRLANKDEGWPHLSFLFRLLVCNIKIDSVFYFAVVGEEFRNTSWINHFLEQCFDQKFGPSSVRVQDCNTKSLTS